MKSYLPDLNVWLALAHQGHQHHPIASAWFDHLQSDQAVFCRFTQLGFLRLITHPAVMRNEVKNQREAWKAYDQLLQDERITFVREDVPEQIEADFRAITDTARFAHQQWPDAYLAAFAKVSGLTLVTFDKALAKLAVSECLMLV